MKRILLGVVLPILVIAAAIAGAYVMYLNREQPQPVTPVRQAPFVRVTIAQPHAETVHVRTHGTVAPRTQSTLAAEVAGRVVQVAPACRDGGFFADGEILLRIESVDYRLALEQRTAEVARAKRALLWEEAEADAAIRDWKSRSDEPPPPLVAREPQLAEARALLRAAEAALEQAQRDLARTEVAAPYAGRVRQQLVDVGAFVNRGEPLAQIYAVDFAEIRLPIPDEDLRFLELPLDARDGAEGPAVTIRVQFAGSMHSWSGQVVRTEGELDPRTRMVHVVAQVPDPYGRNDEQRSVPLAVGMFVEASIHGRTFEDIVAIPRSALRSGGTVHVVDAEDRLHSRTIELLRTERDRLLVRSGLAAGDRVVVSTLEVATEGMLVRPAPVKE